VEKQTDTQTNGNKNPTAPLGNKDAALAKWQAYLLNRMSEAKLL